MSPNANLREQLEIAARLNALRVVRDKDIMNDGYRLAELIVALNEWIARGGSLPDAWAQNTIPQDTKLTDESYVPRADR